MPEKFSGVANLSEFNERVMRITVSEDIEFPYDIGGDYDFLTYEEIKKISFDMLKTELIEIGEKWAFKNFFEVKKFNNFQEKEKYCKQKNIEMEQIDTLIDQWKKTYQERENLAKLRNELRIAALPFDKADTLRKLEDKFGTNPVETDKGINALLKTQIYQMHQNNLNQIIDSEVREPAMYAKTDIITNEKMFKAAIAKVNQMYSKRVLFKGIEFERISVDEKFVKELEQTSDEIIARREKLEELRYLLRANSLKKQNIIEERNYGDFQVTETIQVRMDGNELFKLEGNFGLRLKDPIYGYIDERLNEINSNSRQSMQTSNPKRTRTTEDKEK